MKLKIFFLLYLSFGSLSISQHLTPLEKLNYRQLTSYTDVVNYLKSITSDSKYCSLDTLAESVGGRIIYYVKISQYKHGSNNKKLKVLIFAQQHGNEHSGKEGALLLLNNFANGKLNYLLNKLDIIIIPQMNPDGSEKNQRRNEHGADLNRNHQILTEPEVLGLHKLFNKYLPEATLDVHEYYPYDNEWTQFGYRRDWDETIGTLTNPNISKSIIDFEKGKYLPFIKKYLNDRNFSFHEYVVGGPPQMDRMRFSTVWINDGRQSFGSLNSFSFIQEGKNGIDSAENLEHRAKGQFTALLGFLIFNYENADKIKKIVHDERSKLINGKVNSLVSIRMEHVGNGKQEEMNMVSTHTLRDTVVSLLNFHPFMNNLFTVKRPRGYLIPKSDSKLSNWLVEHSINFGEAKEIKYSDVTVQKIDTIKKDILEEDELIIPVLKIQKVQTVNADEYYFVPTKQLYSNFLVLCLEPSSMFCLYQYDYFNYLLKNNEYFPIMRVEK